MKRKRRFVRALMCVVVTVGILCHGKPSAWNFNDIIISTCIIVMYTAALTHMEALCKHASEICQYINGNLGYSEQTLQPNNTRVPFVIKLCLVSAYSVLPLISLFPLFSVYGLHMFDPCKLSLLGYWMLPQCWVSNYSLLANGILKLILLFANHYLWLYLFSCVPVDLGVVLFLCPMSTAHNLNQ